MTDIDYLEFKARAAADPFWRRLALQALREEVMPKLRKPERPERVETLPMGMISYNQAAAMLNVRVDSIRRHVSQERYTGKNGLIAEADFIAYVMTKGRKLYRENLVRWQESQRNAAPVSRRLTKDRAETLVLNLFAQTA
jgi:ribosomal protein L21E